MFRKFLFLFSLSILTHNLFAQDTLLLLNGRLIPVLNVDFQEYRIAYRKAPKVSLTKTDSGKTDVNQPKKKSRLRTMDPLRVFSVKYQDGSERIIYQPDSLDPLEFSQEQMRIFIQGEQDAAKYYKSNLNKGIGLGVGLASGFFGFYGLAGPPLYSTIMGSFTPNINKYAMEPALLEKSEYREGFERKARDRKIRNTMLSGLTGYIIGVVALSLIY